MAEPSASAFSPGSITCFFLPQPGATPMETSSPGGAINIDQGVTATARPDVRSRLTLNGEEVDLPSVRQLIASMTDATLDVQLTTPLALGCGFGVSAAAGLASGLAVASLLEQSATRRAIAARVHQLEVEHGLGIGDVASQLCGGVVHRHCRRDALDCRRVGHEPATLWVRVFGPLSTRSILGVPERLATLRREGTSALRWFEAVPEPIHLGMLLDRSFAFVERTALLTDRSVRHAIDEVRAAGGHATMILLGHAVLATQPVDDSWQAVRVDPDGARVLP